MADDHTLDDFFAVPLYRAYLRNHLFDGACGHLEIVLAAGEGCSQPVVGVFHIRQVNIHKTR